ncbi:MAG: DUF262 domain-containing protein [Limnohabitans sp.]|nr:DUF262 domain-containing protein [Limnohabitans sp.]
MNSIELASCTIAELFTENIPDTEIQGKLVIPEYQRPYVWGEKEVYKLINDLSNYFENQEQVHSMYYIGSIILHKSNGILNIIDGQQRITTLAILQSLFAENKVPSINYASPITILNIKQNQRLIKKLLLENHNNIDFSKINCTLIVTPNEDDAYTFFETQNTGGVRLSGADILKAFHLRAISIEYRRSEFAIKWETQKRVNEIINYILKARRWNILNFVDVPSHRNENETKKQLILDFSEQTQNSNLDIAYHQISYNSNQSGSHIQIPTYLYSIRQPLNNGENFISYLSSFCLIYSDLFLTKKASISSEYYKFYDTVIKPVDGTAYLKELFEIALMIYVSKFGTTNLLEASFWIFRYTYSLRLSNQKTVREDSIPAFIRNNHYIFDIILSCFSHNELIASLKSEDQFSYVVNENNLVGNTVKSRFLFRVTNYFKIKTSNENIALVYDNELKDSFTELIKEHGEI